MLCSNKAHGKVLLHCWSMCLTVVRYRSLHWTGLYNTIAEELSVFTPPPPYSLTFSASLFSPDICPFPPFFPSPPLGSLSFPFPPPLPPSPFPSSPTHRLEVAEEYTDDAKRRSSYEKHRRSPDFDAPIYGELIVLG